jgi:histidyl-tRNA synthetase
MPFALFLGEDEIQNGTATVKNMVTGEQITDTVEAIVPVIRATIDAKRAEPIIVIK